MTQYPTNLSVLSVSMRTHAHEQSYWFGGFRILNIDWDGQHNWTFTARRDVQFSPSPVRQPLVQLGRVLDASRQLTGFMLDRDIFMLGQLTQLQPRPNSLIPMARVLADCVKSSIDVCDFYGGHAADMGAMASLRNDPVFPLDPEDENVAWESQNEDLLAQFLSHRCAFVWQLLMRASLSDEQRTEAVRAYDRWRAA